MPTQSCVLEGFQGPRVDGQVNRSQPLAALVARDFGETSPLGTVVRGGWIFHGCQNGDSSECWPPVRSAGKTAEKIISPSRHAAGGDLGDLGLGTSCPRSSWTNKRWGASRWPGADIAAWSPFSENHGKPRVCRFGTRSSCHLLTVL